MYNFLMGLSLFGFRFRLFVVVFVFWLMVSFFLVYQIAIGNPFLEEIHPVLVLSIFFVLLGISSYIIPTFRIIVRNGQIFLREGFKVKVFNVADIESFSSYSNGEGVRFDDGKGKVNVFNFGGNRVFKFNLKSGEIIVLYIKDDKVFGSFVKLFQKY